MRQDMKYSDDNIALVKKGIEVELKTNPEFAYSVKVNNVPIVPRTKDIALFDSFLDHINDSTKTITFTHYYGTSPGGNTIILSTDNSKNDRSSETMSGTEVKTDKEELRKQIHNEIHNQFLKEENEKLKKELDKAEKFKREVDSLIGQLNAKRSQVKDKGTWEVIGNFISKITAVHPDLFKENPALEALAGLLPVSEENKTVPPAPVMNASEVTIKPKEEVVPVLDKQTEELVEVLKKLRRHFSEIEFHQCLELIAEMKEHKELIPHATQWVCRQIELKLQWIKRMQESSETKEEAEKEETTRDDTTHYPPYEDEPGIYHP